jgi:uncharacterized protein (TIGR02594 family)
MHSVIDTPWDTTDHLTSLKARGVQSIIRYFNNSNSKKLPEKRVTTTEAAAIADAGLSLVIVFQQGGGAGGRISDLSAENGARDAIRAVEIAETIRQPAGSAIYFAVDHDYFRRADLDQITSYFRAAKQIIEGRFRMGIYGSGTVAGAMRAAGLVELIWLAAAKGWSGTRGMLDTDQWALYQIYPPISDPLPHDGNVISAGWHDYGQFVPGGVTDAGGRAAAARQAPSTVMMEVTARSGLRLRRGPGENFDTETTLPHGTLVYALDRQGDWVQIDIQGDATPDGYMFGGFLAPVSGGLPTTYVSEALRRGAPQSAYEIAKAEMASNVVEARGAANNPPIVMYHNTTNPWSGTADSVAWCSSFVNYCIEMAGLVGTDSQRALDWEDWGNDASEDLREGDIVVFERVGEGGHVGFFVADLGTHITVLGGNQSNRVKLSNYPKDGVLGDYHYRLRGYRRAR